ncbi:hypothetical protein [Phytohabitans houttuyneae]|uniref:CU044_5270 family protein n=1 Tax=Phytohabitans houttuyneae TaxID=1076126 RepID=A0A6V8K680_9ACTN|nr:hypothetical protein [Phytohabitans houttuyneae]GFJ77496.1 hypothetical protein Phou_016760 [Phytohabitans houttuyneae]
MNRQDRDINEPSHASPGDAVNLPGASRKRWSRGGRWLLAAFLVLMLLGPAAASVTFHAPSGQPVTAAADDGATLGPSDSMQLSARERLLRLADTITATPADTARGYAYHHQRRWILDTTGRRDGRGPTRPPGWREHTPAVLAVDIRRWEANNGSGRDITVEVGPDYTLTGADPHHRSTNAEFTRGRTTASRYPAGHQRSIIAGPPAADPDQLARQLAFDPLPDGPPATLRAVDELFTSFYVDLPVRKAALRVLADVNPISYRPGVTDRLGRTGVAVTHTSNRVTHALLFDPATGLLLASEQRSVGAHEYLDVPPGLVRTYTLFLTQTRRPGLR